MGQRVKNLFKTEELSFDDRPGKELFRCEIGSVVLDFFLCLLSQGKVQKLGGIAGEQRLSDDLPGLFIKGGLIPGCGIENRQVEAGKLQKHLMQGAPKRIVSPKGEGEVADSPAYIRTRIPLLQFPGGIDRGFGISVMLGDAGSDRQHVRIEDDRRGIDSRLDKEGVRTLGDRKLPFIACSLSRFVEEHHHERMAEGSDLFRPADEELLSFLQGDRIDDPPPLDLPKGRFDDRPVGGIDHQGRFCDRGVAGDIP